MTDTRELITKFSIGLAIISLVCFLLIDFIDYYQTHPCLESHVETQYKQPMSVVVGGGKNGGGIGVPIGNIRAVQVTVCDKR